MVTGNPDVAGPGKFPESVVFDLCFDQTTIFPTTGFAMKNSLFLFVYRNRDL
jgi:hypothetical protein